ncbi:prepilin peptidase [Halorussus vallis]|nr:A24 family peptidase [Halorussus vallis]USZ77699.1 prepilin peptidase [Halorussus vallis]
MDASVPDLLRLLAVPVFGWAAWRDVETRRIPNRTWYPLAALALVLLAWDGWRAWTGQFGGFEPFAIRVTVSLGFVAPLVVVFWWFRAFGGADAKAFLVVAALFPVFPSYQVLGWGLPYQQTPLGVFSLTILTNTVLVGALYPLTLATTNAVAGRFSTMMAVGKPIRWDAVPRAHGRLLETTGGMDRNGVDLDALRMYLRWRGLTLADVRERTDRFRDPASLPANPNPAGDGAVARDRAVAEAEGDVRARENSDAEPRADGNGVGETLPAGDVPDDDPWGAARFLADIDHGAYGTTPESLREGLDVLATEERVWVSPGIPFIVPLFVGLVVSLTYGDMLFTGLQLLGLPLG